MHNIVKTLRIGDNEACIPTYRISLKRAVCNRRKCIRSLTREFPKMSGSNSSIVVISVDEIVDAAALPSAPADIILININSGKTRANAAKDLVPSWPTYHTSAIFTDD